MDGIFCLFKIFLGDVAWIALAAFVIGCISLVYTSKKFNLSTRPYIRMISKGIKNEEGEIERVHDQGILLCTNNPAKVYSLRFKFMREKTIIQESEQTDLLYYPYIPLEERTANFWELPEDLKSLFRSIEFIYSSFTSPQKFRYIHVQKFIGDKDSGYWQTIEEKDETL